MKKYNVQIVKHIKKFELSLSKTVLDDKIDNYRKYIGKWVVIKSVKNGKITIAEFKEIETENNNYVYLYIPTSINRPSPFGVGGYCGIHITDFDVLDSCDNKEDTEEMFNTAKMKEEANKYNI